MYKHLLLLYLSYVCLASFSSKIRWLFLSISFHLFQASMDGFISLGFQQVFDRYAPDNPSKWRNSSQYNYAYDPVSIIAPLWSDLDTTNITDAGLYVHYFSADETGKVTDTNAQHAFNTTLDAFGTYLTDIGFEPKVLLEATWANVTVAFQPLPPEKFVKREVMLSLCYIVF